MCSTVDFSVVRVAAAGAAVDDAGSAGDVCAAGFGVGVGDGDDVAVGDGDGASAEDILAIDSLPLLLGKGGGTGLLLPLNLPGSRVELLPHT